MSQAWTEGLFECISDVPICLITCIVPGGICFIQSKAVNQANKQGFITPYCIVCCLGVLGGAINRETIRKKLNLEGGFLNSCLTWCFCAYCAACQEFREVFSTNN